MEVISRLSTEWIVSFTLRLNSLTAASQYCSIVHLTQGGNYQSMGDRIGSVFLLREGSTYAKFIFSTGINGEPAQPTVSGINNSAKIEFHQRYLSGGKYRVFIMLNGQEIHSEVNTDAQQFYNVKVYASDPWHPACPGYIKDLTVTNFL